MEKYAPLLMCISVNRGLLPIAHLFLRLGNNIFSKVKKHVCRRIEKQSQEKIEAYSMPLVVELKYDGVWLN